MEVITGIFSESFWYVAPILVTITTALAGVVNGLIAKVYDKGWLKQLISWVLGAGLSVAACFIPGVIEMGEPRWLGIIALCVVVGLSANGFYDIPFIKNFINGWFSKKN